MFAFDPRATLGSRLMPVVRMFAAAQVARLAAHSLTGTPSEHTKFYRWQIQVGIEITLSGSLLFSFDSAFCFTVYLTGLDGNRQLEMLPEPVISRILPWDLVLAAGL